MKAMLLSRIASLAENPLPLSPVEMPQPRPAAGEVLIQVSACGVCHTELDEIEGRTPPPTLPIIPGHQVVGRVVEKGPGSSRFQAGERVGVAWIFSACGECDWCRNGQENLCPHFIATGRDAHGGYAEFMTVPEGFAHPIPSEFSDLEAAPLLCAGAVGYRSLRLAVLPPGGTLGLTGFGASGHLVLKMARGMHPGSPVYVFARSPQERSLALQLGADWAGDIGDVPPGYMDAIIDTTPVWKPVLDALLRLKPGGRLVINAIRKETIDQEELQRMDYAAHLWMEKEVKSVANVTRRDVAQFLRLAAGLGIRPEVQQYPLEEANRALNELKARRIHGAKVLNLSKIQVQNEQS